MQLKINIWNKYILSFTFLLSYLNVISNRIAVRRRIDWYIFTPEAPLLDLVNALIVFAILNFLLAKDYSIIHPEVKWKNLVYSNGKALVFYLLTANLIVLVIALIFGTFSKNFQPIGMVIVNNLEYIVNYFFYAIIFMAYVFYSKNVQQERYLKEIESTLNKSKLANLRAQLNPHFLFNNLNSLDELIHVDKEKASDFLAEFANIYRFCLKNTNQQLITLEEELNFAQSYYDMMIQKYPDEYKLNIKPIEGNAYLIPPFSCQTLLENVIEHNKPEKDSFIHIDIEQQASTLIINNNKGVKIRKNIASGKAIENLKTQYRLLDAPDISIENNNEQFTIKIPLIKK